jgi:hypothetical protein
MDRAALTLGATRRQFWRHVGRPVLWPSFLAILILTFSNAFGTYSTAMALTVSAAAASTGRGSGKRACSGSIVELLRLAQVTAHPDDTPRAQHAWIIRLREQMRRPAVAQRNRALQKQARSTDVTQSISRSARPTSRSARTISGRSAGNAAPPMGSADRAGSRRSMSSSPTGEAGARWTSRAVSLS